MRSSRTAARELGGFEHPSERRRARLDQHADDRDTCRTSSDARALDESALGRIGEPDDVARAVLFLATDWARHVTGQVLRVDGGQLIGVRTRRCE